MSTPVRHTTLALVAACALLYLPFAGNHGLWDPWETHYGEIAREMLERGDYISPWWQASPVDRPEVFHKPVLHFWLMALSMRAFGLEGRAPRPSELVDSWRAEWAERLPSILLSIAAIVAVYELTRRLANRRAAVWSALVLATSVQWFLVSRQAMTDLAFVAPMTIALALAGIALLQPDEPLGRRAPARWGFIVLFVSTVLPQLIMISSQLHVSIKVGSHIWRIAGIVSMLPYIAAFIFGLWWCARARTRRQYYLFSAYVLCGWATLAKGPAGVAMPGLIVVLYLLLSGRWRELLSIEIPRGLILFVAVAFPWYHAMLARHGAAFWNELIGDNYVHRALGRHGDRGTFEYYLQWAAYGLFPWTGLAALGGIFSFRWLRESDPRHRLAGFALLWFAVDFTIVTLVNTKFHHYILPALPALAICAGLLLDEILTRPTRAHALGLLMIAAPVTFLCGRDLSLLPARLLWTFNYDYVNVPNNGRAWPSPAVYGDRYDYTLVLFSITIAASLALLILAWAARSASFKPGAATPLKRLWMLAFAAALAAGVWCGPSTEGGAPPLASPMAWLIPLALSIPFLIAVAWSLGRGETRRRAWCAAWACAAIACVTVLFAGDKMMIELSPHWSQKHLIGAYYAHRAGPEEPLVAWQLYWRGENLYTRNEIYSAKNPADRTVFLSQDRPNEKLTAYLAAHRNRRIFFLAERYRLESLRASLPAEFRSSLSIVDESNNKLYLLTAQN
jgi:4-amino-4-deoxy-L-arabinose transferase-like glycosyltransferase